MADGKQVNLRRLLLERSQEEETAQSVVDAMLAFLREPEKVKPGDALKLYDLLSELQKEDAASVLPDDFPDSPDDLEWNRYSDGDLKSMLAALESGISMTNSSAAASPVSPKSGALHLNLGDFLHE